MRDSINPVLILGALHVHWRLINASNMAIPGLTDGAGDNNCVYMRERVMRMAERILEQPRPYYAITICGGEPTLHPFLPEISRYLLGTTRKVGLTIETNGSQDPAYYEDLLCGLPPGVLRLSVAAHPSGDASNIAEIVVLAARHGQLAHVRLFHDQSFPHNNGFFQSLLLNIPSGAPVIWESHTLPEFCDRPGAGYHTQRPGGETTQLLSGTYDIESAARLALPPRGEKYCCQGTNFLYITPDGYFYGAQCPMTCSPLPLWHEEASLDAERIFHCVSIQCPGGINNILPKFAKLSEARDYFRQYEERKDIWLWQASALYKDQWRKLSPAQKIWLRMSRLKPLAANAANVRLTPCPQMLHGQRENVVSLYQDLEDEESRDIFLRVLVALQNGNAAFLPGEIRPNAEAFHVRPILAIKAEDLETRLPVALAELPDMDISLPMEGRDLLKCLASCRTSLPDYKLRMAFYDGVVHLLADALPRPWKVEGDRETVAEKPVSIIIVCRNAQDNLGRSLDSALVQKSPGLEIIVIDGASQDATLTVIRQREDVAKNIISVLRADQTMDLRRMMQLGLNEAKGKFVLFLRPGDVLAANFLDLLKGFESFNETDLIVGETALLYPQTEETVGLFMEADSSPATAFMEGWAQGFALSACLIKKEFLFRNKIYPAGASGDLELWLGTHIFAAAENIVQAEEGTVARAAVPYAVADDSLTSLAEALKYLERLVDKMGLDEERVSQCVRAIADRYLPPALARMNSGQPNAEKTADLEYMRILAGDRHFVDLFLSRASELFCHQKNLHPVAEPSEEREKANSKSDNSIQVEFYGNESPSSPRLSIILYNRNGETSLEAALDSIFSQSRRDYEVLAVDDSSRDNSLEILRDYVDTCPSLRLYGVAEKTGRGVCCNFAFNMAKGDYCLFMDSAQILEPDFLANIIATNGGADILLYSSQNMLPDGQISWRYPLIDENISGEKAWHLYEAGYIQAQSAAVVYRIAFSRAAGCEFGRDTYQTSDYFLVEALSNARKITSSSFIASSNLVRQDFNLEPAPLNYMQVHSELRLQNFMERVRGELARGQLGPASLTFKNRFFPPICAWKKKTGRSPLKAEDYELLGEMPAFLEALMEDYARQKAWELAKPPESLRPLLGRTSRPVASIIWKGGSADIQRFMRAFLEQDLRELELLLPSGANGACLDDARLKYKKDLSLANAEGEFVLFADYGSRLESGDILRAAAILRRKPKLDFVCLIEPAPFYKEMEAGEFSGQELLALHTNVENAPLHWQACVFRKSFLVENNLEFGEGAEAGEIFMLRVLQKSRLALLLLPEKAHAHKLRFKPGPLAAADFRIMARALATSLAEMTSLPENACKNLLAKFMREANLAPIVSHELEDLASGGSYVRQPD